MPSTSFLLQRRHQLLSGLASIALLAAGCGPAPAADTRANAATDMAKPGMAKASLRHGRFRPAEAKVQGELRILNQNGERLLVLSDDFRTKAGAPDLKLVFSTAQEPLAMSQPPAYPLKANSITVVAPLQAAAGGQRYRIPDSIDLSRQQSVLIWCEQFNATMAWAPLNP